MSIQSKNPATLEVLKEYQELSTQEIENKLSLADKQFPLWRDTSFEDRARLMHKAAKYLKDHKTELGTIISQEMGKTVTAAEAEIEKCAATCDYCADNAAEFLKPEPTEVGATESYLEFDPLGIILAVMPWNFPFWQVFRFAAPTLMAGNVGILKHASNVPQSSLAIEQVFREVGFPEGVFQSLLIGSDKVEGLIRDPRVKAVTLTGSEKAGSLVAKVAGEEIKKTVLELGGSDPFIVLEDADLALAVNLAVLTRLQANLGQSCISAKRFIVHEKVADAFVKGVTEKVQALKIGDPLQRDTEVGAMATEQILRDVEKQVNDSVAMGAKITIGGKRLFEKGYFYAPTVLINVTKGMPVYEQEVFGPVIAVITVKDDAEAIKVANDTPYGLASSIFTTNKERAKKLIPQIEAGMVFVNEQVRSDPRAPFGGIKKSGYGREVSHYGIKEFVNIKSVWIKD
jgi:succinate-semialdehyde dehydrogenase/glutarate-semialdehyde dehydrogenase